MGTFFLEWFDVRSVKGPLPTISKNTPLEF